MFKKVDCLRLPVTDLEQALVFYRDRLGLKLNWRRGDREAGLKMIDSETELVLVKEDLDGPEIDLLVASVDDAVNEFRNKGGNITVEPFDIQIGRCAVIKDPWENEIVILDISKGLLKTDKNHNVI